MHDTIAMLGLRDIILAVREATPKYQIIKRPLPGIMHRPVCIKSSVFSAVNLGGMSMLVSNNRRPSIGIPPK